MLSLSEVHCGYGNIEIIKGISLTVEKGQIVAIIGANGAGKTTVFNMLTGLYKPTSGDIKLNGKSLIGLRPDEWTKAGIARTFQNIRLFGDTSVIDNLLVSQVFHARFGLFSAIVRNKKFYEQEQAMADKAMDMLRRFHLDKKYYMMASNLSYGEQRQLEICRAMMTEPKVLLLDEPCAGMVESEMDEVSQLIHLIREEFDISIILIEHHMSFVMNLAERIKVLNFGETIAEGTPDEVRKNPHVIEAYLGGGVANVEGD